MLVNYKGSKHRAMHTKPFISYEYDYPQDYCDHQVKKIVNLTILGGTSPNANVSVSVEACFILTQSAAVCQHSWILC